MISNITLTVEGQVGSSIKEVAMDMLRLSRHLDMMIVSQFNGIQVIAMPHYTVEQVEKDFDRTLRIKIELDKRKKGD